MKSYPILSLEYAEDYIFDVKFNPVNPFLIASIDGEGFLDIWIFDNKEEPKIHY
jgi:hypothetical protein